MKAFIFAGELSADSHGAQLLRELKSQFADLAISGVAGPTMRAENIHSILQMEDFSVMGFSDVFRNFPRLWKQFHLIRKYILDNQIDLAIFIDSPSLSLRMARALRKHGYKGKIVQYISPTVWAWGKERAQQMARDFDLLLTIYPFEVDHFTHTSLPVEYVGNPVDEAIQNHPYDLKWKEKYNISSEKNLIALFPGSRPSEILRNLPLQLQAVKLFQKNNPEIHVAISCAQENAKSLIENELKRLNYQEAFLVPKSHSYELMRSAHCAIAKSGTVTLELALHHCPTLVMYQLTLLNRLIAQYILRVRLPHYCIVNILGERTIFPELIEEKFSVEDIYENLLKIYEQGNLRQKCKEGCKQVQKMFNGKKASASAALAIKNLFGVR